MTITDIRAAVHRVPLPRPWGPDTPAHHLIVAEVVLSDGRVGTGFSWLPGPGARAVHTLLTEDCRRAATGLAAHPETVWDILSEHLAETGQDGIAALALAAVDTALWDLRASAAGRGIAEELGKRRDSVPVYGSGVNLHYSLSELTDQARRWKDHGYRAVKVKVGLPDLADDVERVTAVREVIGPDIELMIDANQRWDLYRARRAIEALAPCGLSWVEEPLPTDDIAAYVRLRESVRVPLALGENLRGIRQFRDVLTAGACDLLQPNVVRVGGITPFRRIAELARVFSVPVYPHLLPDLSGQLACAVPLPSMVEDVEDASFARLGLLREPHPVAVDGSLLRLADRPGHGLRFDERRLQEVT